MNTQTKNTQALQDFVHEFELMDKYSNISFEAFVEINTQKNSLKIEDKVRITFDGYNNSGTLTIIGERNKINSKLYPEIFDANYQLFEFMNQAYLKIIGNHTKNPDIGKYTVLITPI